MESRRHHAAYRSLSCGNWGYRPSPPLLQNRIMATNQSMIMEQNFNYTNPNLGGQLPPKPDNNLVLAIVTTVCCCLPFGIVAIIKAAKVNGLYLAQQYEAAVKAASDAKKWSLIGIGVGLLVQILYAVAYCFMGLGAALQNIQ